MTTGNRKARRAWATAHRKHIKRGKIYHVEIRHDPECAIYTHARVCNCNPDRVLRDEGGRQLARVEGAGFYDPLEFLEAVE